MGVTLVGSLNDFCLTAPPTLLRISVVLMFAPLGAVLFILSWRFYANLLEFLTSRCHGLNS